MEDHALEDRVINGKSYPPLITMGQLVEIWKKDKAVIREAMKALKLMGIDIGAFYGRYWEINRDVAVECMTNGRLRKAIQAVKEGRVPKGRASA